MNIERTEYSFTATLTNSETTTETIDLSDFTTAAIDLPTTYASTSVSVYKHSPGLGLWLPLYDDAGVAITATVAQGTSVTLPASVFCCGKIRLKTNNAADNARPVGVTLRG